MLNLASFKANFRNLNSARSAAVLGALAIGAIAFSTSAAAAAAQLFPFLLTPPTQYAPPPVQAAPSQDEGAVVEQAARRLLDEQLVGERRVHHAGVDVAGQEVRHQAAAAERHAREGDL